MNLNLNNLKTKVDLKALVATVAIITALIGLILGLYFGQLDYQQKLNDHEDKQQNDKITVIPKQAHKLLGFELNGSDNWQSEITEFKKLDENQGQFKLKFFNNQNKTTIELFQSVNQINPKANITGHDPNTREVFRLNEDQSLIEIGKIENKDYGLILSNKDEFFGNFGYNLVELFETQETDSKSLIQNYKLETDLFTPNSFNNGRQSLKTVITINFREQEESKRQTQIEEVKQLILALKRTDNPELNLNHIRLGTSSSFGEPRLEKVNQGFSENHQATDIVPNEKYYQTDKIYKESGLEVFYAVCEGKTSGFVDSKTQAKVIRLVCDTNKDSDKQVFEYWHNQVNFVGSKEIMKQGQILGIMGSSGNSNGRHLHFVGFENGERKDPSILLEKNQI